MNASSQNPAPASPEPGPAPAPGRGPAILDLPDEAATARLGNSLWAGLRTGDAVGLDGELGAGKTRLVRAVALAAGVDEEEVGSPTFTLVREYRTAAGRPDAPPALFHLDAYRLADADEYDALGPEEFADAGAVLVEWAANVADALPADRLSVALAVTGESTRRATLSAGGPRSAALLASVLAGFGGNADG